jgi:hypothetical protein
VIGTANDGDDGGDGRVMQAQVARIGAILWPSFFAAGVATMTFFALIDPVDLADIAWPHVAVPRNVGYSIGFFMFWVATLSASAFTSLLLRRSDGTTS